MRRRHKLAGIIVLALAAALAASVASGRAGADPVVATVPIDRNQMAWRPVLDTRTGRAFIWPLNVGSVRVFDVATGTVLKTVSIDSAPMAMDVYGYGFVVNEQQDRVFAVGRPTTGSSPFVGDVIALDARTGRLLYRTPVTLGGTMSSWAVDAGARRVFVLGFPNYLPGGAIPDPVGDAVRLSPGSAPVIDAATRRVFVANGASGRMLILDAMSGRQIGTVGTGVTARPWLRPQPWLVVDEHSGRIVELPGGGATVNIRDGTTGRLLHTVTVGSNPAGVAIDEQNERILVTALGPTEQMRGPTGTGSLEVVDERTGTLVRTVPVGMAPYFVALDGPARRALVFNAGGGTVRVPNPWSWVSPWLRRVLPFLPPGVPRTRTVPASVTIIDISHL